jgi:hypothetical protein
LVRTAQATNANEFAVTRVLNVDQAFDPIATVAIAAPTAGFVIVSGTVGIAIEGTGTVGLVRLRDTAASASPTVHAATNRGPSALGAQATTLSPMYVFPGDRRASDRSFWKRSGRVRALFSSPMAPSPPSSSPSAPAGLRGRG